MGPYSKRPLQIAPLRPLGHNFNTSETMWATTRAPSTTPDQTNNLMIDSTSLAVVGMWDLRTALATVVLLG